MNRLPKLLLLASVLGACLRLSAEPASTNHTFNVRDFGARGDGAGLDTRAISSAIAAAEKAGGGRIDFPPGQYLSGTIRLLSHVVLNLEAGARLIGATN